MASPLFPKPKSKAEWFTRSKFINDENKQCLKLFEPYIMEEQNWPNKEEKPKQYTLIEDIALTYFVQMDPEHAN